jgi:hypothetical protein
MAIRISQLQTATSVDGNEFIVIVQNGVTKKITIGETLFEGAQGPAGTGYVFKGNWSSVTGYVVNDVVVYNGSSYVSKTNNNVNHTPGDNTYWGVVALKGDTGAAGATGATGPQGAQGAVGPQGPVGSLDLDANVINNYPNVRPAIDLNFEHQDILDSRVALTRGCEATYFDEFGTLKIAATNEPVFDNNPETGESKGLYVAGPSTDLLFSGLKNDFSAWAKTDTTVTSNIAVAPDGTLTADQIIESIGSLGKGVSYGAQLTVAINRFYTFSVFVKKGIRASAPDHIQIVMGGSAQFGSNSFVNFNISSGIITRVGSNVYDAKVIKLPNGWFRISITTYPGVASSTTSTGGSITFINNNPVAPASPSYTGSTQSDVLVWGPQLEESKRLTPYKYNPYGVVHAQASHAWTLTNVTAIANFTKAPDESYTAERIAETTTNGGHSSSRTSAFTAVAGKTYTSAVYVKKGIGATAPDNILIVYSSTFFSNGRSANFNIATGGVNALSGATTATIEHVGDGWYKCTMSCTATSAGSVGCGISFTNNSSVATIEQTYAGQTTSDIFVWGMHIIEDSATIPEYIRKADVAVINAPNKLPLLEGTVVAKAELPQDLAVDIPFCIPERDKYLFDAKSGNNRVSLYVRKPRNVIAQGTEFQTKNLFIGSEGDASTFSSFSAGISGIVNGIDGFDNAYAFPTNDVSRILYKNAVYVSGQVYTMSFFVKMDDNSAPIPGTTSGTDFAIIMGSTTGVSNITVTLVSGSLYRVSANYTGVTTGNNGANGIQKYASNSAKTFRVTGFQIELGSVATAYQKTTAVKIWSNVNTITMQDQIAAPTGGVFADRILETTASGSHSVLGTFIPKENHEYLYSVYLKKGVGVTAPNIIRLTTSKGGVFSANFADFNIASGAVEYSTGCTGSISSIGSGWYRCSILFPTPEGKASAGLEASNSVHIQFTNNTIGTATSGLVYTGSVDTDIFVWGAQLQEFELSDPSSRTLITYEDGTLPFYTAELTDASGNVSRAEYPMQLLEGIHKFGLSWNQEKLALFIDGIKVSEKTGQFTLTSLPSTSNLCSDYNNKNQWDGSIQRLSIYPRKLDDTIIQAITE